VQRAWAWLGSRFHSSKVSWSHLEISIHRNEAEVKTSVGRQKSHVPWWLCYISYISGWWFQTFFIFHNIWGNSSHWLSYFSRWLKPPTRYSISPLDKMGWTIGLCYSYIYSYMDDKDV
jgi:hypothetical protein